MYDKKFSYRVMFLLIYIMEIRLYLMYLLYTLKACKLYFENFELHHEIQN